ncbi:MAG TPA: adenylate/guanylate cyclase domain-containing protein [Candidatus Cybelea sp.]|jgi:predicted ATPase/class 3 adenylate cyclase/Tfp pilus assembly protein PilF|nr:adenylate/guanylate cyclase domain-containing protein [Candidatus Cybelea sp.]
MGHPTGTVTFLFSDIEGSTQRWERDSAAMSAALKRHDAVMREAIEAHDGYVFKVMGDAFCAAFSATPEALAAAVRAQRALAAEDFSGVNGLRVRMALHAGDAEERGGDYFGPTVNRVARLLAIGHGGQVLVSGTAADLLHDALLPEHGLRDLGLHGLKDLSRAERVFQVLAPDLEDVFPVLRSLEHLPNNLPAQLTSFVGREDDVAEIAALLQRGPLVTLAGPGGIGKTRCALQAAGEMLGEFSDGAWLIDLAPIADPTLVTGTIAQTLGVRETPNRPLLETLAEYLATRQVLLILDNCEHLIDETRRVTVDILHRCPQVRVIATSREPFNAGGELLLRMPSLDVSESVALFTDRARAISPRFAPTGENAAAVTAIATRLEGIPLAIELAAARVRVLSPVQIAQRLDERFRMLVGGDRSALPRRQTLRATIDWSYDLLDERERALLRRLSIFAGDFSIAAATEVCSVPREIDEWDVLDSLTALVDKSLVLADDHDEEQRYRLLQSMREYGLERLHEANEGNGIAERHARYYAQFVANLRPLVDELEDERWKRLCAEELDNIRAAIDWTLARRNDAAVGIGLLSHLEWPEILTAPQEALRWYERAAQEKDAMPDAIAEARILRHYVLLQWLAGRPLADRTATAQRAVEIAASTGDRDEIARALTNLGACHQSGGQFDEAETAFAEAYASSENLSRLSRNAVLRTWAVNDLRRGNPELARRRFLDVASSERPGSEAHASALLNLGELEFTIGSVDAAREAARRACETYQALGSALLVLVLANLAAYAMAAGDLNDARARLREAMGRRYESGRWLVTILDHHALLAALLGDCNRAAILVGFTDAHYRSRGESRQPTEQRGYERLAGLLAGAIEGAELERLRGFGEGLTEEQALSTAAAIYENVQSASP